MFEVRLASNVDLERIFRVVRRTIRGILYFETGHQLEDGFELDVHCNETLADQPFDVLQDLKSMIFEPLACIEPKTIGAGIFSYRYWICPENKNLSVWALVYYEGLAFFGISGPRRT